MGTKLALTSKAADNVLKAVKSVESVCMNNEVSIEELDKNLRTTIKMAVDNEQKLDELSRKLGVQETELKRGLERAELAEKKLKGIGDELTTVGDHMKQLEKSAEKALEREDKLVEKILGLQNKFKQTEARFEYGEMNITKLNQRIDDIEDEIYREKLKIKKCSDELDETFDDMIANYYNFHSILMTLYQYYSLIFPMFIHALNGGLFFAILFPPKTVIPFLTR